MYKLVRPQGRLAGEAPKGWLPAENPGAEILKKTGVETAGMAMKMCEQTTTCGSFVWCEGNNHVELWTGRMNETTKLVKQTQICCNKVKFSSCKRRMIHAKFMRN